MFDYVAEGRWWDRAWSLVEGCTPCSPGCERCWLRAMERRFRPDPMEGAMGPRPVRFRADRLALPGRARKPAAWAVWSDLFHPAVPQYQQHEAWKVMRDCPRHVFLVLTKRPAEMLRVLSGKCSAHGMDLAQPLPNVWLGVTVCNQREADEKIPLLLQVPAAVRFVSYEPALGPIHKLNLFMRSRKTGHVPFGPHGRDGGCPTPCFDDKRWCGCGIDWVIAGGESGPGARPAHPDWFRSVRDQCQAAGVPFFFKQWGEWLPTDQDDLSVVRPGNMRACLAGTGESGEVGLWRRVGKSRAGRLLDGHPYSATPISSPHRCPKCGNVGATACWCRRCNWRPSWMLEPARAH
jgi:protein gp37